LVSAPHIGHLYTAVLADASHRFERLLGHKDSFFVTGTDEHGVKVQEAANAAVMSTEEFCDKVSGEYRNLFQQYGIQFSDFIRTTEERHKLAVHSFWVSSRRYSVPLFCKLIFINQFLLISERAVRQRLYSER